MKSTYLVGGIRPQKKEEEKKKKKNKKENYRTEGGVEGNDSR